MKLILAPWFRAAFDVLVALRGIGYRVEDEDVDALVERATIMEIASHADN